MKLKRNLYITILFLLMAVVLLLNVFCNSKPTAPSPETNTYLNHNDTVKYVGIETCRSCHNDIYKTFIQTGMGQSFDLATRAKSAADFSKKHVVYDKYKDLYYTPSWKGDNFYITEFRLSGKDTIHKREEKVDYIVGSGQHTNSHMMNVDGYVYQMPLTWYAQKRKWDLPPGYEDGHNVRFDRAIGFECMSCHNALPQFEENSTNKFNTIPQGIDCERCHGPGEVHVKEKLAGNRVDTATQIDYTIVNPKKLVWERQIDVCQRCHLQGNAVLKPGKAFTDFRPGMDLSTVMDIYMPKYKGHEDEFIMASHAQRLQMSKCFLSGENHSKESHTSKLTCITCHNPHVSVKVTGKQVFNNACGNCHNMQSACTEKLSVRQASNDNCWGCHMPKSGTIDIPHVTVTDHWIRVPVKKQQKKAQKEFAGIYCINNPKSDAFTQSRAYLSYYEKFNGENASLDSAQFYLKEEKGISETDLTDARIHFFYLRQDYTSIMQQSKNLDVNTCDNAWTCYRIGQAFQNTGVPQSAEGWYKRAVQLAPANLDFMNKLGSIQIELDNTAVGINTLASSLQRNPKQAVALTNIGFGYLKQGNAQLAMKYYDDALALNPDFEQALLNKAGLYNYLGNTGQAKTILKQILKRNPQNVQVKQLLEQL
ncbi:MAG: tetratricopeptide repeat protein [Bacteroidota bacterium]